MLCLDRIRHAILKGMLTRMTRVSFWGASALSLILYSPYKISDTGAKK